MARRSLPLVLGLAVATWVPGCAQPACPASTAPASSATTPLVIGETFRLESKVLGQSRVINVYVPPGYAEGAERYPVLYMPDGGIKEDFPHISGLVDVSIKNQVIRPFIVVGIENIERRHDLVGPSAIPSDLKRAPNPGGAERFREFLRRELKPAIAARYRVTPESAIVGESLAGLFVLETLLLAPELFDSYVAVDPSVWWNDQALVRGAAARFKSWSAGPRALYLATSEEESTRAGAELLGAAIREEHPSGLTWHYQPLPDEHHGTIFPVAALKAFRTMFAATPAAAASTAGPQR